MTDRLGTAWPLKTLLVVLFLGPLLAPLFQATGLPLVADTGALAHNLLSTYICPTPAKSYALLGFPMAVCPRCWGATIGLWLAWLLFQRAGTGDWRLEIGRAQSPISNLSSLGNCLKRALSRPRSVVERRFLRGDPLKLPLFKTPWGLRLGLALAAFLLWPLEIHGWADAPRWVLLLNGASAGLWGGLFLASLRPSAHALSFGALQFWEKGGLRGQPPQSSSNHIVK